MAQTHTAELAQTIHALRNTSLPSQVILGHDARIRNPAEPAGVLLLKPSSGYFPLQTIVEILERLVVRHRYAVRSAAWWAGGDVRANGIMSLHYPGFHRVAHGGLAALSGGARSQLQTCYGYGLSLSTFEQAFGIPFDLAQVRTPYQVVAEGVSPDRLNELWEADRSKDAAAIKTIQRLDEDTFALALEFPDERSLPASLRRRTVVLLNGFYAKLERDFEAKGCVALLIQKEPSSTTSWEALRTEYAGKTNPFQAPPGTVRGDAARGLLQVERISVLANVLHLSATEAEGRREAAQVWWEPNRFARVFGARAANEAA